MKLNKKRRRNSGRRREISCARKIECVFLNSAAEVNEREWLGRHRGGEIIREQYRVAY